MKRKGQILNIAKKNLFHYKSYGLRLPLCIFWSNFISFMEQTLLTAMSWHFSLLPKAMAFLKSSILQIRLFDLFEDRTLFIIIWSFLHSLNLNAANRTERKRFCQHVYQHQNCIQNACFTSSLFSDTHRNMKATRVGVTTCFAMLTSDFCWWTSPKGIRRVRFEQMSSDAVTFSINGGHILDEQENGFRDLLTKRELFHKVWLGSHCLVLII